MNSKQKFEVYELLKRLFSINDAQEIMSFSEDVKYNRDTISTKRKIEIYEIFQKAFSASEAKLLASYILDPKGEEIR